jgi:hypothetical protein
MLTWIKREVYPEKRGSRIISLFSVGLFGRKTHEGEPKIRLSAPCLGRCRVNLEVGISCIVLADAWP